MPRDFKINITTGYDPGASQQAASDLENVGKKAGEAGERGQEAGKKMEVSHREAHRLLSDLGENIVPGFGHALGELALGPLGALLAIISAAGAIKQHLEEINEKLEETAAKASEAFGDRWKAAREVTADLAKEAEHFSLALESASEASDKIKQSQEDSKELISAQVDALKEELKAMEDLELAQHPEDAEWIHTKYSLLNRDLSATEREAKIQEDQKAYNDASNAQAGLDSDARAKREATREPLDRLKEKDDQVKALETERDEIKKNAIKNDADIIDKLKGPQDELAFIQQHAATHPGDKYDAERDAQLNHEIEDLSRQMSAFKLSEINATIAHLDSQRISAQQNADTATHAAEEAQSRATANQKFTTDLGPRLSQEVRVEGVRGGADDIVRRLDLLTNAIKSSGGQSPEQIANAGITDLLQSHVRNQSQNHDEPVNLLRQILSSGGFTNQAIINILNQLLTQHTQQATVVGEIKARLADLQNQVSSGAVLNHK